jgi:hypothetical protein
MPRERAHTPPVVMPVYVPGLILFKALDFVGKAMFGRRWRKATKQLDDYDRTIERGRPNAIEAKRRAEEQFLPCRKTIEKLCDFLFGDIPDNRNAVPACFQPRDTRIGEIVIAASMWRRAEEGPNCYDEALKFFRTEWLCYDEESEKLVPYSTLDSMRPRELVVGRIIVLKQHFMSRLVDEFPDAAREIAPKRRTPLKQQAAVRALKRLFRERAKELKATEHVLNEVNASPELKEVGKISKYTLRRAIAAIKAESPRSKRKSRSK